MLYVCGCIRIQRIHYTTSFYSIFLDLQEMGKIPTPPIFEREIRIRSQIHLIRKGSGCFGYCGACSWF